MQSSPGGANQRLMAKRNKNPLDHLELALIGAGPSTYANLLEHCAQAKSLFHGKYVHEHIVQHGYHKDSFISNLVLQMYIKCGSVDQAREVFNGMDKPNVVSWTTMVSAYAQNGHPEEALQMSQLMELNGLKPDKVTLLCLVGVRASLGDLQQATYLHQRISLLGHDQEIPLANALIHMYEECGSLENAKKVFENMPLRNVVSWNSMIAAYAQYGHPEEAVELYKSMSGSAGGYIKPDGVTFINLLSGFVLEEHLEQGREIHSAVNERGFHEDVVVSTSLMSMYGRCMSSYDARGVFDRLHKKNVVSWNTMISVYNAVNSPQEALDLYKLMESQYVQPDHITFTGVLTACASLGLVENVKLIHAQAKTFREDTNSLFLTSLLNAYCSCGNVLEARAVFDSMTNKDSVAWNSMISGYAHHGHPLEALHLYKLMDVSITDQVTFVNLLDACSHGGLVSAARYHFNCMVQLGVPPSVKHFGCMVSLLGRAGRLEDAEKLIESMETVHVDVNAVVWSMFLDACRSSNDVERAARAAARILELEPHTPQPYVVLSHICSNQRTESTGHSRRPGVQVALSRKPS